MNFNSIQDKLNEHFEKSSRTIVFWYDDNGEFTEAIERLELGSAKVLRLEADNQFQTKYILERQEPDVSFLVYAPFSKPNERDNALEDIFQYSMQFHADKISMLCNELGIPSGLKSRLQAYSKFFSAKDRTKRFTDLPIDHYTESVVDIAVMAAICKLERANFETIIQNVLSTCELEENTYLAEFENYRVIDAFWSQCEEVLGYRSETPNLIELSLTLFVNFFISQVTETKEIPASWECYRSYKPSSVITFVTNYMNNSNARSSFDELSTKIARLLDLTTILQDVSKDALVGVDVFELVDQKIIKWMIKQLIDENTTACLGGYGLHDLCDFRMQTHFGNVYKNQYSLIQYALLIISNVNYQAKPEFDVLLKKYLECDYKIDASYRMFYQAYDKLVETSAYEVLRQLIENIYTNRFLGVLLPVWNNSIDVKEVLRGKDSQLNFYKNVISPQKDKTVVIISDGFRYEVANDLQKALEDNPNCNSSMQYMLSTIPAYTQLGMAALLPHNELKIIDDGKVLVDEKPSDSTTNREVILRSTQDNGTCYNYQDILAIKTSELRELFKGTDVKYIYHDKIDNRGSNSPNDVFKACEETVNDIYQLIDRLRKSANVGSFVVTADHGFLYKRDKFSESEKIDLKEKKGDYFNRRFIIADKSVESSGITSIALSDIIGGDTTKVLSFPTGANVFKTAGGLNYVHGASSPQEMIIPLITVKTERGIVETQVVKIALVSTIKKITNLITAVDFIQLDAICDTIEEAEYRVFFQSNDNEVISNVLIINANKRESESDKRITRLKFNFKNKKYDNKQKYWLIAVNNNTGVELFRHDIIMDLFTEDFGFGF